jgi:hypothetical protein
MWTVPCLAPSAKPAALNTPTRPSRRRIAWYPNYIPMKTGDVRALRERLMSFDFEQVSGFSWGRNIASGGRAAVDASFHRHLEKVEP